MSTMSYENHIVRLRDKVDAITVPLWDLKKIHEKRGLSK
jgi:hypothetical protein